MDNLIRNERLKLLANALDRASTAFVTVGVLAPTAAAIYNLGTSNVGVPFAAGSFAVWLFCAFALHWGARALLKGLRQ